MRAAVEEFTFLIDNREKTPYTIVGAKSARLLVGDYTILGYEDIFAVERKSYEDIYDCLTDKQTRFISQLKRLGALRRSYLLIDCTLSAFMLGHVFHKIRGPRALERLTRLCIRHGVPFSFCDRRGGDLTTAILLQFWKEARK